MRIRRKALAKNGISAAVSALIGWGILSAKGFSQTAALAERYRLLCDAFFVPSVLFLSAGILIFASNCGQFHSVSYASRFLARVFLPGNFNRAESYGDFLARKGEKEKIKGYSFLFYFGAALLCMALVFLLLFYRVYEG